MNAQPHPRTSGLAPRLAAAMALASLVTFALPVAAAGPKGAVRPVLSVGDRAPTFFLTAINADRVGVRRVVLSKLLKEEGTKIVVLSFFATWCGPCKKELPVLQKLWEAYREDGLRVVVISIDKEPEAVAELGTFIETFGLTFPVLSDRFNLLARRYLGTTLSLPSLFILDKEGKVQAMHQSYGDDAGPRLEGEIASLLGLEASRGVVPATALAPEGEAAAEGGARGEDTGSKKAPKKKRRRGKKPPKKEG